MTETTDMETGEVKEDEAPSKLRFWNKLWQTDPRHSTSFSRPGGFRGTAIKPIWNYYRLTEEFGPHGIGWGTEKPDYQIVPAGDETLVFCVLRCWYMDEDGQRAELYGIGGDKVVAKRREGALADDEAFKKAFTDALGNAFVRLGLSADVHMGMFESSKYVESVTRKFQGERRQAIETRASVVSGPNVGIMGSAEKDGGVTRVLAIAWYKVAMAMYKRPDLTYSELQREGIAAESSKPFVAFIRELAPATFEKLLAADQEARNRFAGSVEARAAGPDVPF